VPEAPTPPNPSGVLNTPSLQHSTTPPPSVPDHELLRRIGGGSYGEVWLARNKLGTLRAIKVVYRKTFEDARPFEREFKGIQKFEPISRSHEGLVDILQVGGTEDYFYYVMELADDSNAECGVRSAEPTLTRPSDTLSHPMGEGRGEGESIPSSEFRTPHSYAPRTLRHDVKQRGRLPINQCVQIGQSLASALAHLHAQGLVHRDVKPSNIIFVKGVPKLADIGLVADASEARSFVGTEGFIPPEGPGAAQADLYSLGKVLYEISTGRDRRDFPALPDDLAEDETMLELNAVILKACKTDPKERYQSAEEMQADLALLQEGKSVKRQRTMQRSLAAVVKVTLVAGAIALIAVGAFRLRQLVSKNQFGGPGGTPQLEMKGTKNREAWNAYIKGQHYFNRLTSEGIKQGIAFMEEAIRLDPNFAQAYAALAELYGWGEDVFTTRQEAMAKTKDAAQTALALDDSLPQAHKMLGYVEAFFERDFSKSIKELKRAIELSPDYASAHEYYGWILLGRGRLEEATKELKRAQWLDPVSPRICCELSRLFRFTGQVDEAVMQLRKALGLDPSHVEAFRQFVVVHEEKGEFLEAIEMSQKAAVANGIEPARAAQSSDDLRRAFSTGGARGYWQEKLRSANGRSNFAGELYDIAVIYLHLGDTDSALDFLEKVEATRSDIAYDLNFDRRFYSVRSDHRFHGLLRKLGLEE